ncbi:hypothetical protein LIER_38283 [Lithospermum erythrorhizon]|uniref:Reverse transcriptase Ty1/copia-type domain-containing protein n=1 Tax=Lithospermum erythrorhizon TaxID=34254 RepID=A0AAV3PXJ6_LITER
MPNTFMSGENNDKKVEKSEDEFVKFTLYQDSLKGSSIPTAALVNSSNQNTCLISSSLKFIIDTGATDHMSVKSVPEAPHNSVTPSVSLPHTGAPSIPDVPVFDVKTNPDGSIARLKARFVAKGYGKTYGVDYLDTFAPVAKLTSVKLFLPLAATYDWQLYQLDIKNAFLHGDLEEELYIVTTRLESYALEVRIVINLYI